MRYELVCHPDTPASAIARISVWVWPIGKQRKERSVEFLVSHEDSLALPPMKAPARADGLWRTTCFELFLQRAECDGYTEINLSPSFEWAAYNFDGYREGMRDAALLFEPEVAVSPAPDHFFIETEFDVSGFEAGEVRMGLSAVIEETDGTKSYWALAHAPGPPDFHNRDCFIATLPAPDAA